ncbi:TonB-dependent receptor plug domain-containing protein [Halorhodospira sp. 9622]|uniref:TonB-dependent receptor plug domain-containing protein n=1 Tax=Halorhodospira sp. 9622 TaxID=2899136 RepID=UPI001EE97674|nr:TonB-dependent receptor plug domain-containing protein [Halorhodospira sp. 9622]MCG5539045.1 TonB-dependent receptor plug domain-containing protein [Halorhodospira sp. 9622]
MHPKRTQTPLLTCTSLAVLGALSTTAGADEAPTALPEVLVEPPEEIEGSGTERISRQQSHRLQDLFRGDSESHVGGPRQARRLYLRGIEGSQTRVTVDGARQGRDLHNHRGGLAGIDPAFLRYAEAEPGPPAADDGHGATGGSVRFETIDAGDLVDPETGYGGFARGVRGSAADSLATSAAGAIYPTERIGLLVGGSYTTTEDYRLGGGEIKDYTAYDDRNLLLRLNADGEQQRVRLGYEENENLGELPLSGGDRPPFEEDDLADQRMVRETTSLNYEFHPETRWVDLELDLYRNQSEWEDRDEGVGFLSDGVGGRLANTATLARGSLGPLGHGENRLTVGGDIERDTGEGDHPSRGGDILTYESQGAFIQNRLESERLDLSLGVRGDWMETDYEQLGESVDFSEVSTNARIGYWATPSTELFVGYGESAQGRSGTTTLHLDRNIGSRDQFDENEVPDDFNLDEFEATRIEYDDPQTSATTEAGIRSEQPLAGGRLELSGTLFRTDIDDLILYGFEQPTRLGRQPIQSIYNLDDQITTEGYTLKAAWRGEALYSSVSFTHDKVRGLGDGDTLTPGEPSGRQQLVRAVGPQGDRLVWDSVYQFHHAFQVGYTLKAVADLERVIPGDGERDGYTTHDVQMRWQPGGDEDVTLYFIVHNLFDEEYASHTAIPRYAAGETVEDSDYAREPGRDMRLGAKVRF